MSQHRGQCQCHPTGSYARVCWYLRKALQHRPKELHQDLHEGVRKKLSRHRALEVCGEAAWETLLERSPTFGSGEGCLHSDTRVSLGGSRSRARIAVSATAVDHRTGEPKSFRPCLTVPFLGASPELGRMVRYCKSMLARRQMWLMNSVALPGKGPAGMLRRRVERLCPG